MAIEHEEEWGIVGRPLSLCAHDKCDPFQVVVLVILIFTRQLAQSGFECLIGSIINPDGQWLSMVDNSIRVILGQSEKEYQL